MSLKYRRQSLILADLVTSCKICPAPDDDPNSRTTSQKSESEDAESKVIGPRRLKSSITEFNLSEHNQLKRKKSKSGKSKRINPAEKRGSQDLLEGVSKAQAVAHVAETVNTTNNEAGIRL